MTTKTVIASLLLLASIGVHADTRPFSLEGLSPEFWNLFDRKAQMTKAGSGFGFTEGPVWDPAGYLWVSDETLNKIFKLDTRTGQKQEVISLGDPDGNTYDRQHRLLDCASVLRAVIRLSPDGKTYETVADHYQGMRLNSPNDVVPGPDGAIYFTDPTSDLPKDQKQEIPFKGVYRIAPDGQVQLLTKDLDEPNGLAFSPDGKKFYVDDSTRKNIRVYDFHNGQLSNGRIFGEEPGGPHDGVPDGMKVDRQGNLYVVGPLGIWVWDPAGHHLGTIVVPEQPANLAWGDAGYSTLYITATTSVYKISTRAHGFIPYL
ncbi:MAG: SMP-30/gluconolactonase/LRE family protein [Acidobacteriaceae bacterium]